MSSNWSSGWRKLVEWDDGEKVYKYKGHNIYPLSYKEQLEMPLHLQNESYWYDIYHIDGLVMEEEMRKHQKPPDVSVDDAMKNLFLFWES